MDGLPNLSDEFPGRTWKSVLPQFAIALLRTSRYIPAPTFNEDQSTYALRRLCRETQMQARPLLRHVLEDEAITRGLGDPEARVLVEWLVDWAELLAQDADTEEEAWTGMRTLCQRARSIGRFVSLWSEEETRGAACQLAACERFHWPLPNEDEDPAEMMARILVWEDREILV